MRYTSFIYRHVALVTLAITTTMQAEAQTVTERAVIEGGKICGIGITDIAVKRDADLMTIGMNFNTGKFDIDGNRAVVFAPMLVNGKDTLIFQSFCLYSRTRWYQFLRAGEKPFLEEGEKAIRWTERPQTIDFSQTVPYADWMDGSELWLRRYDYGCRGILIVEEAKPLASWRELKYVPQFHYVSPVAEKDKTRELVGKAYIDFPVNRTELHPDYRKNPVELAKIIATIDSVRNDKDVTVKHITIKGWASPESSWENNTRLAKGRTATLKQYVQNLYNFPEGFIQTDYYPEDWIGLREFVETSGLTHKNEILALIDDTTIDPDPKEALIKKRYPEEYKFLLQTVYPGLRHSDYTIEYTIRQFTDVNEIREIMATAPQKLSLNEMFLLAQSLEPGSDAYNEVFETAVRMYPNNETANLNAANAAMQRGDYASAERYLAKAGNGDEVTYAKGVLAAQQEDYTIAIQYFSQVDGKLPEAAEALQTVKGIMQYAGK